MRSLLLQRRRSSVLAMENLNNLNLSRRRSSLLEETRAPPSPPTPTSSSSSVATTSLPQFPPKSTVDISERNSYCKTQYNFLNNGTALENPESNNNTNNNSNKMIDKEREKSKKNPKVLNNVLKYSCRRMSKQLETMVADDSLRRFVVIIFLMGFIILFAVVYSCYKMILKQLHQIQ